MAPKKRLLRRGQAVDGHPNLEEAAAERIDAVTAEPLHPVRFVEIMSPDGTLRLFYNTTTLIRIATDRGMFMQPPHFREPMLPSLQRDVEKIEGRTFRFERSNVLLRDATNGSDEAVHVFHRHVYFDQIMDEFYRLNPAELYVCPSCYLHWISTRLIPYLTTTRQRIDYLEGDPNPVIDPLNVFAHMQGVENAPAGETENTDLVAAGGVADETDNVPLTIPSMDAVSDWDSPLVHIVFRRAVSWKRHVRLHHNDTGTAAVDYRLKEFLSQYISQYNRHLEEKSRKWRQRGGAGSSGSPELTVSRYWHINARYNRLRYNRIVEAVERAESHLDECVNQTAFPNETVMNTFHSIDQDSSESNFICDTESSSDSSDECDRRFPRYEGSLGSDDGTATGGAKGTRKRRRASSQSTSTSSLTTEEEDDDEEDVREQQRRVFKSGILAPLSEPYREYTYEERRVLDAHSRRSVKPTLLYMPSPQDGIDGSCDDDDQDVDWDQIGETIDGAAVYVRDMLKQQQQEQNSATSPPPKQQNTKTMTSSQDTPTPRVQRSAESKQSTYTPMTAGRLHRLMLDDDDDAVVVPTGGGVVTATPDASASKGQRRLLLDDSD